MNNLKDFAENIDGFRKPIFSFISNVLIQKASVKSLADTFTKVDTNKDGKISKQEIKDAISRANASGANLDMSDEDLDRHFRAVDTNNSGMIEFSEFVTASMERGLQLCQ